jgi:hypothetical protein
MAKRTIWKFVSVGALGLLVFVFGVLLLVVAAPLFVPDTGGFVFAVSTRAFNIALIVLLTVVAAALFFFARTDRRRRLK